jgi:hypothetical protein
MPDIKSNTGRFRNVLRFILWWLFFASTSFFIFCLWSHDYDIIDSVFFWVWVVVVGCMAIAIVLAVEFSPFLWLLAWLAHRKSKRKH